MQFFFSLSFCVRVCFYTGSDATFAFMFSCFNCEFYGDSSEAFGLMSLSFCCKFSFLL